MTPGKTRRQGVERTDFMAQRTRGTTCAAAVAQVDALLADTAAVVAEVHPADYARPALGGGTIGAHLRHSLDHVRALAAGVAAGTVAYERGRRRGGIEEFDRDAGLEGLKAARAGLASLVDEPFTRPLVAALMFASDSEPEPIPTTLGRELAFVLSHTIHHNALVGYLALGFGYQPPAAFGYAPATIAFLAGAGGSREP